MTEMRGISKKNYRQSEKIVGKSWQLCNPFDVKYKRKNPLKVPWTQYPGRLKIAR